MNLLHLRLLLTLAEERSIQAAARKLGLTRSSLRRRMESLEAEVGTPLFVRAASGISLTPAGRLLAEDGAPLVEQGERLLARARAADTTAVGNLRLVIPVGIRKDILIGMLSALRALNPELRIVERESEDPLSLLGEPFDLMIHFGERPPPGDWYSRVFARVPFRLLAAPGYIDRFGRPQALDDLAAHPHLAWRGSAPSPHLLPLRDGGTFPIQPWFVSSNLEVVMGAVGAGMGLCVGPTQPDSEGLVPLLPDHVGTEMTLRTLARHPSASDARTRAVQETISQFVAVFPEV